MLIENLIIDWLKNYFRDSKVQDSFENLFLSYLNLKKKQVIPTKRKVFISKELKEKSIPMPEEDYLSLLKSKIEIGEDISYALSNDANRPHKKDGLLIDWGIHHLHLIDPKFPKSRGDYLLFVIFPPDEAGFLDIRRHDEKRLFEKKDYIQIIYNNWPKALDPFILKGFNQTYTEEALEKSRRKFRKIGANLMVEINGKLFAPPGGGFNSGGGSANDIIIMDKYQEYLLSIQHIFNEDDNFIIHHMLMSNESKVYGKLNITEIYPEIIIHSESKNTNYHLRVNSGHSA
ncbi:hypothetical protein [Leptospira stimsonii]|uniref:Uncharacterized protein n=1 Tax=Leptospira stimsonii TaxID=2202203 RepID=A0ABY2N9R9_9LEPT|nr:hypothetical protein [Leptospira stimsonii]TGK18855.1 hypothetical protein EHO98_12140 [Leptospira stimsonii]TGM18968.1 hypothetical protein EHQ90_05430 [Leptospira stimsonii]